MAGTRVASREWVYLTMALLLILAGGLLLAADRSAAEEEPVVEDNPPVLLGASLSPSSLSSAGGNVQIGAEVGDDFGVAMVYAQIYGPDGGTQSIQLFESEPTKYFGTLEVPANYSDSSVSYGVEIQAYDTNGAYIGSLVGDVQVEGVPQFDEAPFVSEALVTPTQLPAEGGAVTISASASDNRSVSAVFATVALVGGGSTEVLLQPVSFNRYEGTFTAPPNSGPAAAEYLVEVSVQDDIGQEARVGADGITVAAPPAQATGRLAIWSAATSFGPVRVGTRARRLLVVRNSGPRGSAPVEGVMKVSGSAFSLLGGLSDGIHFRLRPGALRVFVVEFRPSGVGAQAGAITIARDDGGQPDLTAALTGQGVPASRWWPPRRWR